MENRTKLQATRQIKIHGSYKIVLNVSFRYTRIGIQRIARIYHAIMKRNHKRILTPFCSIQRKLHIVKCVIQNILFVYPNQKQVLKQIFGNIDSRIGMITIKTSIMGNDDKRRVSGDVFRQIYFNKVHDRMGFITRIMNHALKVQFLEVKNNIGRFVKIDTMVLISIHLYSIHII